MPSTMKLTMNLPISALAVLACVIRGASGLICDTRRGMEAWGANCYLPNCDQFFAYCEVLPEGVPRPPEICTVKPGNEVWGQHCQSERCATSYSAWCQRVYDDAPPPTATTTLAPTTTPTTTRAPTTTPTTTRAPTTTKAPGSGPSHTDCTVHANAHPFPVDMLSDHCAKQLVLSLCGKYSAQCSDEACVVNRLNEFYAAMGLIVGSGPDDCAAVAAKGTLPALSPHCQQQVLISECETLRGHCGHHACVESGMDTFCTMLGGSFGTDNAVPVDCAAVVAKGSVGDLSPHCQHDVLTHQCETFRVVCSDRIECVESHMTSFCVMVGGSFA